MHDGFGVSVLHHGQAALVTVWGELDLETAPDVHRALDEAFAHPSSTVVIDLVNLTFLGVAGVHALVRAFWRATLEERELRLFPSPPVERVLRALDLHLLLGTCCCA